MGFQVKTFGAAAELKGGQPDRAGVFFALRGRLRCPKRSVASSTSATVALIAEDLPGRV